VKEWEIGIMWNKEVNIHGEREIWKYRQDGGAGKEPEEREKN
jgi:hypothetical protein